MTMIYTIDMPIKPRDPNTNPEFSILTKFVHPCLIMQRAVPGDSGPGGNQLTLGNVW